MIPDNSASASAIQFRVLSERQIEDIHSAVLKVLWKVGVDIHSDQALSLLKEAGAEVLDRRAKIPASLIEQALERVPHCIDFYSRDGELAMQLRGRNVYFGPIGGVYAIDPFTGQRRLATKQDIANHSRICDYLPNFDWTMPMGVPSDAPNEVSERYGFQAAILNQSKPIYSAAYTLAGLADIVEMCSIIAGGMETLRQRPFFFTGIDPTSPLMYSEIPMQKLLFMAERGLPFTVNCGTLAGATGPSTLAGTLVVVAAEGLTALAIAQLKRKGTPVMLGGFFSTMDMVTTSLCYGAPELPLMMAAYADLTRYYRVPMFSTGGCTNSKLVDQQTAIEAALGLLFAAQSGANLVHDVSLIDTGMTLSPDAMVLCDEIIAMVKRMMEGVHVDDESLAVETIGRVGPGGHYLGEDHTLRHFREHHRSRLIDRQNYDAWSKSGALSMGDRVNAEARRILESYTPKPLPEDVQAEIQRVVDVAGKKDQTL